MSDTTRLGKASRLAVFSWVLYDLSNTVFATSILTFFFPLWVEQQVGSGGFLSGVGLVNGATAFTALLVVLTAPVFGAVADLRQRRVPYLIFLTVAAVALSPPEKIGEFFGLFSLAGKVSAVFGPALTAVLLFVFGGGAVGYRISIGSPS